MVLFLVLRDTDDQICVSVDEEIEAIVIIDSPLPDIVRSSHFFAQIEDAVKATGTLCLRAR
jgi:hypothetical protein